MRVEVEHDRARHARAPRRHSRGSCRRRSARAARRTGWPPSRSPAPARRCRARRRPASRAHPGQRQSNTVDVGRQGLADVHVLTADDATEGLKSIGKISGREIWRKDRRRHGQVLASNVQMNRSRSTRRCVTRARAQPLQAERNGFGRHALQSQRRTCGPAVNPLLQQQSRIAACCRQAVCAGQPERKFLAAGKRGS